MEKTKYIAVCAARDEEKFIAQSLGAVLNQTIPPEICVLSDDGSSDVTPLIAEKLGAHIIHVTTKRHKMDGINQALALKTGINKAITNTPEWSFLLKFDADTKIPLNYTEHLIKIMQKYPKLGICSGKPDHENIRLARASDAAKIYRRECWEDINGLDPWVAFDSHAIIKAAQTGWVTKTISNITFKEMRPSGKYGIKRWIITGFERASFGFPLYHTVLASIKNVKWGSPPILNVLATILAHIVNPWPNAPDIDPEWIKQYAINEIRFFIKEVREGLTSTPSQQSEGR